MRWQVEEYKVAKCLEARALKWVWVENGYPQWNPSKYYNLCFSGGFLFWPVPKWLCFESFWQGLAPKVGTPWVLKASHFFAGCLCVCATCFLSKQPASEASRAHEELDMHAAACCPKCFYHHIVWMKYAPPRCRVRAKSVQGCGLPHLPCANSEAGMTL